MLKGLIKKYGKSFDGDAPKGKDDWAKWTYMRGSYEQAKTKDDKSAGIIMQKIIKGYFDGVEKVFKSNVKQVQDILTRYMQRRRTDSNWDEIVTNDFKIKKVWIIEDADAFIGDTKNFEEFKSNISFTKLPIEIVNAMEMEKYVRDVANKATGRT
jgi:hypothetical protein